MINDTSDQTISTIIESLEDLGAPKDSKLMLGDDDNRELSFGKLEGMALFLNGTDLPAEVYKNSDVNETIAECNRLLEGIGSLRGYWEGSHETALYFYGTTYVDMEITVKPFIDSEPSCAKTRFVKIA